jgi:hypothetical protein
MIKLTENQREILQALLDGKEIEFFARDWMEVQTTGELLTAFYNNRQVRIKPRTIIVNGVEVPEPMKVKPEYGTIYYVARPASTDGIPWYDDGFDNSHLSAGVCHSTPEAATLHWEAMIKPSKIVQE